MPTSPEKDSVIGRLTSSTYNRNSGIIVKYVGLIDRKRLVLRAPRPVMADSGYIGREETILRYVRHNTNLPVADAISLNSRMNDPLESGYVLHSRQLEISLHAIWYEFT